MTTYIIHSKTNEIVAKKTNGNIEFLTKEDIDYLINNNKKIWNKIVFCKNYLIYETNRDSELNKCYYCNSDNINFSMLFNFVDDFYTELICYGIDFFCDNCFNCKVDSLDCGGYDIIKSLARIPKTNNWVVFSDYDNLPSIYSNDKINKTVLNDKKIIINSNKMNDLINYFNNSFLDKYKKIFIKSLT